MAETESIRDGVFLLFVSSGNNNQNKVRRDWSESSPLKPANMEAPQQHGGFFSFLFFSSFFLLSLSTVLRLCPFSQTIQKSLEGCYRNCIQSDKAAGSRLSTRGRPCIGIAAAGGFHGCWCVCEGQVSPCGLCGLCGLSEGSGLDTVVTGCCSSPEPPTFTDSQLKTRPSFYKRDPPSMSVSVWKDKVETRRSVLEPD